MSLDQVRHKLTDQDQRGGLVFTGGCGIGKSHQLLALYHVLIHPDLAAQSGGWSSAVWKRSVRAGSEGRRHCSMSYEVFTIPAFDKAVKRLRKKYRRIKADLERLVETLKAKPNPAVL
jgi:DNA replication protein DnaC